MTEKTETLHIVYTFNAVNELKTAIELSANSIYKVCISTAISPDNTRVIDVMYHLTCCVPNIDCILQQNEKLQQGSDTGVMSDETPEIIAAIVDFF